MGREGFVPYKGALSFWRNLKLVEGKQANPPVHPRDILKKTKTEGGKNAIGLIHHTLLQKRLSKKRN